MPEPVRDPERPDSILVPASAELEDGAIVDALVPIGPDDPAYADADRWLTEHGQ